MNIFYEDLPETLKINGKEYPIITDFREWIRFSDMLKSDLQPQYKLEFLAEMFLGTVVGIVAICYVIGLGCKAYEKIPDKWIPVIMAACGGALGVVGLYTMSDFPASDVINAIAVGMASGLAATGVNQLYKQQCK